MVGLFGIGPNSVEIPCMLFESMEKAQLFVHNSLSEDSYSERKSKKGITFFEIDEDYLSEVGHKFFTSYYGGCGEIYSYELREVEFETKLVRFSLD